MPDFYQHKLISTLHQFADPVLEEQEEALQRYVRRRPVSLVMPALYSEVKQPALQKICDELAKVSYIDEVVISMNRMNAEEFAHAKDFFGRLPQKHHIIWNDGPRLGKIYDEMAEAQLTHYLPGKGYNVWMAYGYIIARGEARVIAAHDSDIISYHREMLTRLCMPTVHPTMAYEYCKSYYGRVSDRMYGRVTRLFVFPLLQCLDLAIGQHPLLDYLESFRYPLSGEFSITTELARTLRLPGDWGLEIGMLCEVYRNTTTRRVCQVDLGSNFEHKHQHIGADPGDEQPTADKGLVKMARDIALTLFTNLSAAGVVLSPALMRTLRVSYERLAKESIQRYRDDSLINGLVFFRHEEAAAVEAFCTSLEVAAAKYLDEHYHSPHIPNWNRVFSALPHFEDLVQEAVDADMKT